MQKLRAFPAAVAWVSKGLEPEDLLVQAQCEVLLNNYKDDTALASLLGHTVPNPGTLLRKALLDRHGWVAPGRPAVQEGKGQGKRKRSSSGSTATHVAGASNAGAADEPSCQPPAKRFRLPKPDSDAIEAVVLEYFNPTDPRNADTCQIIPTWPQAKTKVSLAPVTWAYWPFAITRAHTVRVCVCISHMHYCTVGCTCKLIGQPGARHSLCTCDMQT